MNSRFSGAVRSRSWTGTPCRNWSCRRDSCRRRPRSSTGPVPGWKAWYQEGAAGIAVVLIALTAYLFFTVQRDRSRKKMNALFAALPIHVGVVDGRGRILFYQAGNPVFSTRRPKRLPELPLELLREIERPLAEVFRTGAPARLEYGVFGTYLQLELLSLPRQIFRREAVMWISADVTQLHQGVYRHDPACRQLPADPRFDRRCRDRDGLRRRYCPDEPDGAEADGVGGEYGGRPEGR